MQNSQKFETEFNIEDLKNLFINIPIGIFRTSRDGKIVMANPALAQILGYNSVEEILDLNIEKDGLVHAYNRNNFIEEIEKKGEIIGIESIWIKKDKTQIFFREDARLIRNQATNEVYYEGTVIDISKQKIAELQLKENDSLKAEFISHITHELRTPLTSIIGFGKLIKDALEKNVLTEIPENHKTHKYIKQSKSDIEIIVTEGQRLMNLINDISDLSKLESGRFDWRFDMISINTTVDKAIEIINPIYVNKKIALKNNIPINLPMVRGDSRMLTQAFYSILANAVKYSTEGEVVITSELSNTDLLIKISDKGIGIADQLIEVLFIQHKQSKFPNLNKTKTTGLSLAVCKKIIDSHNGKIWVESTINKGSTFYIKLPLK